MRGLTVSPIVCTLLLTLFVASSALAAQALACSVAYAEAVPGVAADPADATGYKGGALHQRSRTGPPRPCDAHPSSASTRPSTV